MTQLSLALRVNCDRSLISRIESGKVTRPDGRFIERCEQVLRLNPGALADRIVKDDVPDSQWAVSTAIVWPTFPYERARSIIGGASQNIRILQTWVPNVQPLLQAIEAGLAKGARLEILVLDPVSDAAHRRLEALHIGDPLYAWMHLYKLYHELWSSCARYSSSWEIRTYSISPALEIYGSDAMLLLGYFWTGGFSMERPHLEVATTNALGERATLEFEELWSGPVVVVDDTELARLRKTL